MILHEADDEVLILGQATPRAKLEDGKRIRVARPPTHFGEVNLILRSRVADGVIEAGVEANFRRRPSFLIVRFRHPKKAVIREVSVNRRPWMAFEPDREWVRLPHPEAVRYFIEARY